LLDRLALVAGSAAAFCVGFVFLMAAVSKFRHRTLLPGVIANYRLLPDAAVAPVAMLLPAVELLVCVALIGGEYRVTPVVAILLLLTFAAAMAINLRRGRRNIDCGCGQSHLRQSLSWALVWRNLLLSAILLPRLAAPGLPTPAEAGIALAAGSAFFLLYLLFNALLALPGLTTSRT
jgi:hypothetical protein